MFAVICRMCSLTNVDRGNSADKLQPRSIKVSCQKNSNVAMDVMVFIFYSDELVIDVDKVVIKQIFKNIITLLSYHSNVINVFDHGTPNMVKIT